MSGTWNGTGIRWTDETWNPVHGCAKSGSPGCANCYAERVSHKFNNTHLPWLPSNASENVQVKPYKLDELDSLPDPCWVFVNSMSDLYHEYVPDGFIEKTYAKLAEHPTSAFQILTKHGADYDRDALNPPENVMLGVSVGHPDWRYRIDWLREQDAQTKFVSFEPVVACIPEVDLSGIDWAIVGGESGPNNVRREMDPAWARNLIRACWRQDVAVFFKQHSGTKPESNIEIDMGQGPQKIEQFPGLPSGVAPAPREFRAIADGGHLPSDIRDGPHSVCPETGDPIPIESSTFTKLGLHAGDHEERYVELSFEDSVCDRCEAETEHRIETDWKRNRAKSECSECGLIETIRFTSGGDA